MQASCYVCVLLLSQIVHCTFLRSKSVDNEVGNRLDLLPNFLTKKGEIENTSEKESVTSNVQTPATLPTEFNSHLTVSYDIPSTTLRSKLKHLGSTKHPKVRLPATNERIKNTFANEFRKRKLPQKHVKVPDDTRAEPSRQMLTSGEKLDKANRAFDRLLQFINIVGQLDTFVHERASLAVRKLAAVVHEEDKFRRGHYS